MKLIALILHALCTSVSGLVVSAASLALVPAITAAQPATSSAGTASSSTTAGDDSLYRQLGGQAGLTALMDELMNRLLADPRMNPFFADTDQPHIKAQLVVQVCQLSGGPCRLVGPDMVKAHAGVDIRRSDFNAMVEVLQQAMDARGIGFRVQSRLLARLAPMHREIVNAE